MSKLIRFKLLFLTLCAANLAQAEDTICMYRDFFHPSFDTPPAVRLLSLSGDINVQVAQQNDYSFKVTDTNDCPLNGGYVKVRYGTDEKHFCDLNIHDSALLWDPDITAHCTGLFYNGSTYDGKPTYSYSLHFSQP